MLEIMLSKLHVTSLAIKEQIKRGKKKKKNSLGLHLVHFFFLNHGRVKRSVSQER